MPGPNDPPADELPGVEAVGHRKHKDDVGSFPEQPPPMWVPDVAEIGAENPEPGPCDSPQTKEEYDADAATGRALAEVFRRIQQAGEYFATREYAALLVRNAAGGVDVVRLEAGPGVDLDRQLILMGWMPHRSLGISIRIPEAAPERRRQLIGQTFTHTSSMLA